MDKIQVVFWSQGGNTQAMAEAVGQRIREAGKEAEVVFVSGASAETLKEAKVFALGSYGWGDGQWMRDWVERMSEAGATVLNGEGVMSHEAPDDVLAECVALGKQLAGI